MPGASIQRIDDAGRAAVHLGDSGQHAIRLPPILPLTYKLCGSTSYSQLKVSHSADPTSVDELLKILRCRKIEIFKVLSMKHQPSPCKSILGGFMPVIYRGRITFF